MAVKYILLSAVSVRGIPADELPSRVLLTHLPPGQNGRHFVNDIFMCFFVNGRFCILIIISLKNVSTCLIDNDPTLV